MPGPANTLLIEGTFEELGNELAHYLDNLKKTQGDESPGIETECAKDLEEDKKDDALKKLVTASAALNSAPEKEFIAAYNLLIHLIRQSEKMTMFLPKICNNLSAPITSAPSHAPGLALSVLSTIFNIMPATSENRYHVFFAILRVVRSASNFEVLNPQLKHLDAWLAQWEVDEEEQRKLYLAVADVAEESAEDEVAYQYMVRALRTYTADESSNEEARQLSIRALKAALIHPSHFDFQDLIELDSIQSLRKSDPVHFELLEIFNAEQLDEFNDFKEEHEGWIDEAGFDSQVLNRKMRLLTLASLAAASGQARELPYARIAKALQIPSEEVEMWVIDVIRAGLVEGKLSQLKQTFLIHRSTYRVFGDNQWREVAARLDMWKSSLEGVLGVIRQEKLNYMQQKEQELRESSGGFGRGRRAQEVEAE